jgi:hypothetical protein
MNSEDASPSARCEVQSCSAGASNADDATSPRLHDRLPFDGLLHLCWEDRQTGKRRINARGIDRSKFGILVEAERPISTGTLVSVETANFTVVGRASVRHCSPNGMNYRIGLYMPDRLVSDL